jgi:hypothetical protein
MEIHEGQANLSDDLIRESNQAATGIDTSRTGQLGIGVGAAVAVGSLAYYLGTDTDYFVDAASSSEVPLYAAFAAISAISVAELVGICGRRSPKTLLTGLLTGGATGAGIGLGVAGIALGLTADLFTCGAFTAGGLIIGWLLSRRGKKKHDCGARLPCDTWICPRCRRIISPPRNWREKDLWNILDVCDYLDTGGRAMDSVKAIAFLDYTGLLDKGIYVLGSPAVWKPEDVKRKSLDTGLVNDFALKWRRFEEFEGLTGPHEDLGIKHLLAQWQEFWRHEARRSTS